MSIPNCSLSQQLPKRDFKRMPPPPYTLRAFRFACEPNGHYQMWKTPGRRGKHLASSSSCASTLITRLPVITSQRMRMERNLIEIPTRQQVTNMEDIPEVSSTTEIHNNDETNTKASRISRSSKSSTSYCPRSLSGIPLIIRVGNKNVPIGNIQVEIRACENQDFEPLMHFWKRVTSSLNKRNDGFPCTTQDSTVVASSALKGIQSDLSYIAEAVYKLGGRGENNRSICGFILASKLTCRDFVVSMSQCYSYLFPGEWAMILSLFKPSAKTLIDLFVKFGDALFINVYIIDVNVAQSNNPSITLSLYEEIFQKAVRAAWEKGMKMAFYVAKDKNEVNIFKVLGFIILSQLRLDPLNEITLMVRHPG